MWKCEICGYENNPEDKDYCVFCGHKRRDISKKNRRKKRSINIKILINNHNYNVKKYGETLLKIFNFILDVLYYSVHLIIFVILIFLLIKFVLPVYRGGTL